MKLKFLTIKRKTIFALLLCLFILGGCVGTYYAVRETSSPKPLHTIVIDAGHGGIDVKKGQYKF